MDMPVEDVLDCYWCRRAQDTVGVTIPRQVGLGSIRKVAEQEQEKKASK